MWLYLEVGVLWEVIRSEGEVLMNEINTLKRPQRASSPLPSMWGYREKMAVYESGSRSSPDSESAGTLILDFLVYRTVRNIHCLQATWSKVFLLLQPERTKTITSSTHCICYLNIFKLHVYVKERKWKSLSCVWLFATPWTVWYMEFSRPEYWSSLFLLQGIFPI